MTLEWEQKRWFRISTCGRYVVSKSAGSAGNCYTAWGPDIGRTALEAKMKVRYAQGEQIPQRRSMLGVFEVAGEAAAACQSHADQPGAVGPSGA